MAQGDLRLLRVVARGPGLIATVERFGDVEYRCEPSSQTAIYVTLQLPGRLSGLHGPIRSDEMLKITALKLPLSRSVGVEFCGTLIDPLVQGAGAAETGAARVLALAPILGYLQKNFTAT